MAVRSPFLEFGCIHSSTGDQPQILTGGDPLSGEVAAYCESDDGAYIQY